METDRGVLIDLSMDSGTEGLSFMAGAVALPNGVSVSMDRGLHRYWGCECRLEGQGRQDRMEKDLAGFRCSRVNIFYDDCRG